MCVYQNIDRVRWRSFPESNPILPLCLRLIVFFFFFFFFFFFLLLLHPMCAIRPILIRAQSNTYIDERLRSFESKSFTNLPPLMAQSLLLSSTCNLPSPHFQRQALPRRPAAFAAPAIRLLPQLPTPAKRAAVQPASTQSTSPEEEAGEPKSTIESVFSSTNFEGGSSGRREKTDLNLHVFSLGCIPQWAKVMLVGSVLLLAAIPIWIKNHKIQDVMRKADAVVEVVVTVAEGVKEAAKEMNEALPNGRLKETAFKLQKVASLVGKNAAIADSFLDKVDDAVGELDMDLRPIVEAVGLEKDEEGKKTVAAAEMVVTSTAGEAKEKTAAAAATVLATTTADLKKDQLNS
ncbi:hypothetical protein AXF42_Ash004055 [Apostasia shenzhenica]|uniref:Uncharacterized protein n=1 Tax=Apostasia shenzhenica TaxID=1088818 RepID=A0A2I0A1V0_9ASPA|nr:hypothetical protein AXF42_Ash004055 [Apostasia shenzhenica]